MYRFYKIKCPRCGHQFVWLEGTCKGSGFYLYRRKGFDEELESTPCPKCDVEMAVLTDSLEGICIQEESIEIAGTVRGI